MPKTIQPGGTIELLRSPDSVTPDLRRGWKIAAHRTVKKDHGVGRQDGPIMDLRLNTPGNWAHSQIFHLPLAAMAKEWINQTPTALLPFNTPGYIQRLYGHFGFPVITTDREVEGDIIVPKLSANDVLRPARRELVAPLIRDLDNRRLQGKLPADLPQKIFVSRRKTRRLENEKEVENLLTPLGFVKVYPEELPVPEQIEMFNSAVEIVAIHGAALAPLLYRSPDARPLSLVEILSPGHVATSYRLMASQVGGKYIGVRGRIKPELVEPSYRLDRSFTEYSLADFSVELESIRCAMEFVETHRLPEFV